MKKQWQEEISLLIIHRLLCPCPIFWGDLIILFSLFLAFLSPRMFSDICNADNNTVQCYSLPFVYIFKCQNTNTTLMQIPIMGIHLNYPFQVENGGHLCKTSKLVPDGPGGHRCEVGHQRAKLFIKLQPSELGKGDQRQWMSYMYQRIPRKHTQRKKKDAAGVLHSTAGLSVLINKSLPDDFSPSMSVTWWEVMQMVGAAPSWPSMVAHPAEGAFQNGLLHFHWYQVGHQASECIIDDRRKGHLVKTTGNSKWKIPIYQGGNW